MQLEISEVFVDPITRCGNTRRRSAGPLSCFITADVLELRYAATGAALRLPSAAPSAPHHPPPHLVPIN